MVCLQKVEEREREENLAVISKAAKTVGKGGKMLKLPKGSKTKVKLLPKGHRVVPKIDSAMHMLNKITLDDVRRTRALVR
jgi:hypothetical protein